MKNKAKAFTEFCAQVDQHWDFHVISISEDENICCYVPKGFPKPTKEQLEACPAEQHEKSVRGKLTCYQVGCNFCPHKCYQIGGNA